MRRQWRQGLALRKRFGKSVQQRLAVQWDQELWKGLERDGRQRLGLSDVWDLNGIHLLTAVSTVAQKDNQMEHHAGAQEEPTVPVHGNPIPTLNRFSAFQETDGDEENLEPNESKICANRFGCWMWCIGVCHGRRFFERTS